MTISPPSPAEWRGGLLSFNFQFRKVSAPYCCCSIQLCSLTDLFGRKGIKNFFFSCGKSQLSEPRGRKIQLSKINRCFIHCWPGCTNGLRRMAVLLFCFPAWFGMLWGKEKGQWKSFQGVAGVTGGLMEIVKFGSYWFMLC